MWCQNKGLKCSMMSSNNYQTDCAAGLHITGGDGMSINSPLVITYDGGLNDYVGKEHLYIRCVCEARRLRNWKIAKQSLLIHEGRYIDCIEVTHVEGRVWRKEIVKESYYFDITDVKQSSKDSYSSEIRIIEWNKYNLVVKFFDTLEQYQKFFVRLKTSAVANEEGTCIAELTKEDGYYKYLLHWIEDEIYIGDYVKVFKPTPENLEIFNLGCEVLAERLTIYIDTQDTKEVPEIPPAFGKLTHVK